MLRDANLLMADTIHTPQAATAEHNADCTVEDCLELQRNMSCLQVNTGTPAAVKAALHANCHSTSAGAGGQCSLYVNAVLITNHLTQGAQPLASRSLRLLTPCLQAGQAKYM